MLLAALNVLDGDRAVPTAAPPSEFLKFLERLDTTIDRKRQKIPLACLRFRKAKNFFPQHNR